MRRPIERVHEDGVARHGSLWPRSNQRAVDSAIGSSIKPWDPGVSDLIPRALLSVLDGIKLDAGYEWKAGATEWTKAPGPPNPATAFGVVHRATAELVKAVALLNGTGKLDANQIAYVTGVTQALKWLLMIDGTEPPTKGF